MIDDPDKTDDDEGPKKSRVLRWAIFRSIGGAVVSLVLLGGVLVFLLGLFHPDTPLPDASNPTKPLAVADAVTPFTSTKLRAALSDPSQCVAVLQEATNASPLPPFEASENCHIRNRVSLSSVGSARINLVETACATALRLAMWERHGVQPAARDILGTEATTIRQIGSYNCRSIRTTNGNSTRPSTHSTADAIDITGFGFADGQRIRLIDDWDGDTPEAQFLRVVRDSACDWFATTLGPDYNSLHADHFHLQARGWGTCR